MDIPDRTRYKMRGKSIEKVFRIISQNEIEFKLAISAILLSFGEENESLSVDLNGGEDKNLEESNYVLKIIMTSFNPVELTTKLGGPWEGYFLWDTIRGKMFNTGKEDGGQRRSLLDFIRLMGNCHSSQKTTLSMRLMNFGEYMDSVLNSESIGGVPGDSKQDKDYVLAIKLEGVDSEMVLRLRSTSSPDYYTNPSSVEDISIMKCLRDVVEQIKQENSNLHENLRSLAEFSISHKQIEGGNKRGEESRYDADNNQDINASDVISSSPIQFNSPNTRGTLELSELRNPSCLNNSKVTGRLLDNTNSSPHIPVFEKQSVNRKAGNFEMNCGHACSRPPSSETLHSQMKAYRFIKRDSPDCASYRNGSYSTSSLPACCYHSSSASERNSALRSALESVRRNRNELLSRQTDSPPHATGRLDFSNDKNSFYNHQDDVVKPSYKTSNCSDFDSDYFHCSKYFQKLSKNRQRAGNLEEANGDYNHFRNNRNRNHFELNTPEKLRKFVPLYTREQLMNKLSNTRDISERINILKNMIKNTKKESYHFDEFD